MSDWRGVMSASNLLQLHEVTSTNIVIGKGSYGQVTEVYVHGALCAAKEVHPILVNGITPAELETTKQSFLTECVNASRIHHPNIVLVLGIHYPTPEAKLPWLVMEMMNCSLKAFLEKYRKNKVPYHIKLSILVDISEGLEFLHGQNIIHRDLSSNNVLLTKHCVAKIADLGMAKVMDQNRMKTQTQVPGTLHFMPPETLLRKPRYGKPVDVFSLGCVACHVMSHQWPEPKDLLLEGSLIALTEVERREDYLKFCSEESLRELIESCLRNSPDQRPEISSVCAELEELKLVENERAPFSIGMMELLDVAQKQRLQINKLIDTMRVMEVIIQEKDRKIHELLLNEIKKDCVSVDEPQSMALNVSEESSTAVEAEQNCLRYANIGMANENEEWKTTGRKVEVDIDANLATQHGNICNYLERAREGTPDEFNALVSQNQNVQFTENSKKKQPKFEKHNCACVDSQPPTLDANNERNGLEMEGKSYLNIEASNGADCVPQYDYVDLTANRKIVWIKAIEQERVEKEHTVVDALYSHYGNVDLAASNVVKKLKKRTEGEKASGDPWYGNFDIIAMQHESSTVNLDIPHNKKPVATPRANRYAVTLSSSYKASTSLTPKWYCAACELLNKVCSPCEDCMNECTEFIGFCSGCNLMVPVSSEESKIDCPVCLTELEAKRN